MSYKAGIIEAITELKDRTGSSMISIKKFMQDKLPADKKWQNATFLLALKNGVTAGDFVKNKNSYKLSADFKKNVAAKAKAQEKKEAAATKKTAAPKKAAPKAKAPVKKTTSKAAAAKKTAKTSTKSTTTTTKKAAPKKVTSTCTFYFVWLDSDLTELLFNFKQPDDSDKENNNHKESVSS